MKRNKIKKLAIGITLIALSGLIWFNAKPTTDYKQSSINEASQPHLEKHGRSPGYYAQWFEEKKNKDGIIPYGLYHQWKADIARKANLRTANLSPITTIAEAGPFNIGGRTRDILIDRTNPNRIFATAAGGGLWRSNDAGATFAPYDDQMASLGGSSLCQSPFNPSEIYYGTGGSSGPIGAGLFKSTDGGITFNVLPSTLNYPAMERILKLEHGRQPGNTETLYLGTKQGKLFRTEDGGNTNWTKIFEGNNVIRDIIAFPDGGVMFTESEVGIWYTPDGAAALASGSTSGSFVQLSSSQFPTDPIGRIEIANCYDAAPSTVYALFGGRGSNDQPIALLKSTNQGQSWVSRQTPNTGTIQGQFAVVLGVSPSDPDRLFAGSLNPKISLNGANNWNNIDDFHPDYHAFAAESGSNEFLVGHDGGISKLPWQAGGNGVSLNNGYSVTQFYGGDHGVTGEVAMAGSQDNGTRKVEPGLTTFIGSGDGGYCYVRDDDGDRGYFSYQNGAIRRFHGFTSSNPNNGTPMNNLAAMDNSGYDFINFYTINEFDGEQVYSRTNSGIWRTVNAGGPAGEDWTKITAGNRPKFKRIAVTPVADPVMYAGGLDGMFFRIDNAATAAIGTEVALTSPNFSTDNISSITIHPQNDDIAFVTFGNFASTPRIYRVNGDLNPPTPLNNADRWTSISGDLPQDLPVNALALHPLFPDQIMFAGTDHGLFYTIDGGQNWTYEPAVPAVAIKELKLRESDGSLWIFTYGRGIWRAQLNLCPAISSFPYYEDFEQVGQVWSNSAGDDFDWSWNTGGTPTANTGPNGAFSGTRYMYTENTGNVGNKTAGLVSQCFDLRSMNAPELYWHYHMNGADIGRLSLDVSTNMGLTWNNNIWTRFGHQATGWLPVNLDLSPIPYAAQGQVQFRFRVVTTAGPGTAGDIGLDLIRIADASPRLLESQDPELAQDQPSLYPNPASDWVTIELPKSWKGPAMVRIMDMSGKVLRNESILPHQPERLSLQGLSPGVYLVSASDKKGHVFNHKLVKR